MIFVCEKTGLGDAVLPSRASLSLSPSFFFFSFSFGILLSLLSVFWLLLLVLFYYFFLLSCHLGRRSRSRPPLFFILFFLIFCSPSSLSFVPFACRILFFFLLSCHAHLYIHMFTISSSSPSFVSLFIRLFILFPIPPLLFHSPIYSRSLGPLSRALSFIYSLLYSSSTLSPILLLLGFFLLGSISALSLTLFLLSISLSYFCSCLFGSKFSSFLPVTSRPFFYYYNFCLFLYHFYFPLPV